MADDFHFCGAGREIGATYCKCHARIAYGPGTPSDRKALKAAIRAAA
jgi:hypothetical protein